MDKTVSTERQHRRGPGRPEGQTDLRERILDAAELDFAELGYAGTSLRLVADKVGVNSAMIGYYFTSKQNLFREVFLRKGLRIAEQRMQSLVALHEAEVPPGTRDLVRAFLMPTLELRSTAQDRAFLRLHSRLHMEPAALAYALRREVYDVSTRAYAEAFQKALPHLDQSIIYRRISLMIGGYLYAFSDTNRLDELVPPGVTPRDNVDELENIVSYCAAGMEA